MARWRSQSFRTGALKAGVNPTVVENAIGAAERVLGVNPELPPVLSLRHLAHLSDTPYGLLRKYASRESFDPYTTFRIHKRPLNGWIRYRTIAVPEPALLKVQRWITQKILVHARPHEASVAFSKGDTLYEAVAGHCGCRWLIKVDIRNFFESINEISVYRVFQSLGYQRLVAFELTRLCTRMGGESRIRSKRRWHLDWEKWTAIPRYEAWNPTGGPRIGHLPQGAPSSPMLGNLAVQEVDKEIASVAKAFGLTYTRYADDILLSTRRDDFSRSNGRTVVGKVTAALGKWGLGANSAKTTISPPGGRKLALGLLLDGGSPKLPRDFKANLRQHLYYLENPAIGPVGHARERGFASVTGLRNHLQGLISFALQIEPEYGNQVRARLATVDWPL